MGREHARIIAGLDRSRVVGVADPDRNTARAVAGSLPSAAVYETPGDLLSGEELDVIHVCSPPSLHFEHAHQALDSGRHVYVEKPFTLDTRQADDLLDLANESNLKICAGHQLKFALDSEEVLSGLRAVAPVTHVESHFHFRPSAAKAGRVRADDQLLDILPHPVYLLLHFLDNTAQEGDATDVEHLITGPRATVHGMLRRGEVTGLLHVTLEGRPVDSHVRIVGGGGDLTLDYILEESFLVPDRGGSGLGKILNPLSLSAQKASAAVRAGIRHALGKGESYPGLNDLIGAFHDAILSGNGSPVSADEIRSTVEILERTADELGRPSAGNSQTSNTGIKVAVTGGTGFLGQPVLRRLVEQGARVRSLSRGGEPAPWDQVPGVDYVACDLSENSPGDAFEGAEVVIHAAAATSGGWEEHKGHSIEATERVLRSAAEAEVRHVLYISSLAVVGSEQDGDPIDEDTPLLKEPQEAGPYTWGKTEAERRARELAKELSIDVKIIRPGAVIDHDDFEPPGKLGRSIGPFFFAVGSPDECLGVVDREFAADTIARGALQFQLFPDTLNLLDPDLPSRGDLVGELKTARPSKRIIWLPRRVIAAVDPLALLAQRVLRSGEQPISLWEVFRDRQYHTHGVEQYVRRSAERGEDVVTV